MNIRISCGKNELRIFLILCISINKSGTQLCGEKVFNKNSFYWVKRESPNHKQSEQPYIIYVHGVFGLLVYIWQEVKKIKLLVFISENTDYYIACVIKLI